MKRSRMEEQVIRNYENDEQMMILIFAQWCVNHDLDPAALYAQAYPQQEANVRLRMAVELTVPKEEAGYIGDETVLGALSLFGNDELAVIVTEQIAKRKNKPGR